MTPSIFDLYDQPHALDETEQTSPALEPFPSPGSSRSGGRHAPTQTGCSSGSAGWAAASSPIPDAQLPAAELQRMPGRPADGPGPTDRGASGAVASSGGEDRVAARTRGPIGPTPEPRSYSVGNPPTSDADAAPSRVQGQGPPLARKSELLPERRVWEAPTENAYGEPVKLLRDIYQGSPEAEARLDELRRALGADKPRNPRRP